MDLPPVIYKVLPIIIILLISWLFGMIGAKRKRPTDEHAQDREHAGEQAQGPTSLSDLFLPPVKEESAPPLTAPNRSEASVHAGYTAQGLDASHIGHGPIVTPDPIEPRWWGS
jgi:hypothetical protein